MARGQLRVYLGSAPGVGKTYRMLDEGWRRKGRGTDVVIGFVETHGRPLTEAQLRDIEIVPRTSREYRGTRFDEMDLEAILTRSPKVVLVDELAHTNVPGGRHAKRWQDVEDLLDAGVDVITTVNIQHLESVNDVVEKITGVTQQETVPDVVVRRAEQVELVDITPEALRRRMAHGNIYTADKIDASLSNYFRTGNLSALREIALLWLADRVEDALQRYQQDHDIDTTWETRERLIVGVTGTAVDEILLRRAARIASRNGAALLAVHVVNADGLHQPLLDTSVARGLVEEFGGNYREIVDDDVATALVSFARSERGTQIVLGASRPRSALRRMSGVVESVLRHARDLDVHIIAVGAERPTRVRARRAKRRVNWRRTVLALAVGALVMTAVTLMMASVRGDLSLSTEILVYLVVVMALSSWGGALVGVVGALAAAGLENYYFVVPLHAFEVSRPDNVVSLVVFLLFAIGASLVVDRFTHQSNEADRARSEAEILARAVADGTGSHRDLLVLLDTLRTVFAASGVAVLKRAGEVWRTDLVSGAEPDPATSTNRFVVGEDYVLVLDGVQLDAQDRQLAEAFAGRIAAGLRSIVIAEDAAQLRVIAEAEALRMGTLRSVSRDLGASLDAIHAKLDGLLHEAQARSTTQFRSDLEAIEADVQRLHRLHANLRDVGRLETGNVAPSPTTVSASALVRRSLRSVDTRGRDVDIDVAADLPSFTTDLEMAVRAIEVVLNNACRFSPPDLLVRVTAGVAGDVLEILVIDRGPGMTVEQRTVVLDPLQWSGEQSGADLGLTVASGFLNLLGGRLRFEDTPTGGLTVALEFPLREMGPRRSPEHAGDLDPESPAP